MHIDRITSPQGASIAIAGTLGGVEVGPGMKYALDDEGGLEHRLRSQTGRAAGLLAKPCKINFDLAVTRQVNISPASCDQK